MRSRLAMRTIGNLLAIGNEFCTHCQRVGHAGFAALLVGVGGFEGEGRENETKQRQPKRRPSKSGGAESAHVPAILKAAAMPSAVAMRKRFDSQFTRESGSLS